MGLTEYHHSDLRRSGLTDETIAAAGFYSLSAGEAKALLGRRDVGSGMAIPYPGCTFSDGTPYVRVRLDVPLVIRGRPARYLTRKGERNRLYIPPTLPLSALTDPNAPLVITEGEKKALKACQEGIPCVGLAGVWSWKTRSGMDTKSIPLPDLDAVAWQGRPVSIVFDSDIASKPEVRRARSALAKELVRRGARVRLPELPPGPNGEKVGVDDYLVSHSREAFQALEEVAPLWESPKKPGPARQSDDGAGDEGRSQADRLVSLVVAERVELFHDQTGDTYALVPVREHREIWPCRGKQLKRWLAGRLWQTERKAANSEALTAALNVIEAQARFEGEEHELHNRVARHEDAIWYDLGDRDWRAVRVTAQGWEVVSHPPVLFRRYAHQRPQVEPKRGGNLRDLVRFVNVHDGAQAVLCQVYVVSCFVPDIPHPIPDVHGGQGTAKTTMLRMLRRLIDPSAVEVLSLPHDRKELVQQLAHHWTPYYDNITGLSAWASDALCRASTGEGFTKRELYSDDDDVIYQFRRCPGLNGINVAARKPDLLERCLLVELAPIPEGRRRPEKQLWREFEEARPRLLGAIFDALSRAAALLDSVSLPELPRMADFAIWGCAISQALGYSLDDFLAAYGCNQEIRNDEALQASPVAIMVLALMEDRDEWRGTASELLTELKELADQHGVDTRLGDWPKAANALSRELNTVRPTLATVGIDLQRGSEGTRRWTWLYRRAGQTVNTVRTATGTPDDGSGVPARDGIPGLPRTPSKVPSREEATGDRGDDTGDDTDADDDLPWRSAEGGSGPGSAGPSAHAGGPALLTDRRVPSATPGAVSQVGSRPVTALAPCPHCRGARFWRHRAGGGWNCVTCHPPASEDVVAEWPKVAGEEGADA